MAQATWALTAVVPNDRAAQTLRALQGFEGMTAFADKGGNRVAVAFFATSKQAESAQAAAVYDVPGNGHVTASPGATVAWINYSGRLRVDQSVGSCGAKAGG